MDVPAGFEDLFDDDSRAFLALATVRAADEPVVAPVWFVTDAAGLLFTTGTQSAKARDMRLRPLVAGIVMAEGDHERYVSVRGTAVELADLEAEGIDAEDLHRRIVRRYEGRDPSGPFDGTVFRLVASRVKGYDYRDLGV
jgi:hypothetical protein